MAKKKEEQPVADAAPETAAAAPEAETEVKEKPAKAPKSEPITVKYRDHKGEETSRTFSKEDHGENFAKVAEEFKATNASRIIA